jgi:hypothetical protein
MKRGVTAVNRFGALISQPFCEKNQRIVHRSIQGNEPRRESFARALPLPH